MLGRLTVHWPDGREATDAGQPGPNGAALAIADWATVRRLVLDPSLAFGEAYMDDGLTAGGVRHLRGAGRADRQSGQQRQRASACSNSCLVARCARAALRAIQSSGPRAPTSRIITISTAASIACSSTVTGNIPAPISRAAMRRSRKRSWRRSAISLPNSVSTGPI